MTSSSKEATVSVVIPLYNKGKYIERALSSVFSQTYQPLEIIVVDDGSTDNGPERVLSFNDLKTVLMRQENNGPGAARNAGLAKARGKYIAFLDADDEWLPSFLEAGISVLENVKTNATVVCTGRIKSPDMSKSAFDGSDGVYEIIPETDISFVRKIFKFRHIPNFMIMRTEIVRTLGGYFDRNKCLRGEDCFLSIKILFNEKIGILSSPHGIYHTEASELCGNPGEVPFNELPPYLIDPAEIILSCHPSKHHLLYELLSDLLYSELRVLAICGSNGKAKKLLKDFSSKCQIPTKQKLKMKLLVIISPMVPTIRRLWKLKIFIDL